jgi:hypothetical protein
MLERTLIGWVAVTALALSSQLVQAQAQSKFKSGIYSISSGLYSECCGFAGNPFDYELPDERLGAVELVVAPDGKTARMTFLSPDLSTVFTSYPWIAERTFAFSFGNGIVSSNSIQFGEGPPAPRPGLPDWNYTVQDQGGNLLINGVAVTPMFGADVPNQFTHTSVAATRILDPIVVDRIERQGDSMVFHFTGPQLYDYTIEYTDSLTDPNWQTNSTHRAKLGPIDLVVTNSLSESQTRFFRIRQEFCKCR